MYSNYQLNRTTYRRINSYLTMAASHFIFSSSFSGSMRMLNKTPRQMQLRENIFQLSASAYFRRNGFTNVRFIQNDTTGVNSVVLGNNRYCLVVFRGTEMNGLEELVFKADNTVNTLFLQSSGGRRYGTNSLIHSGWRIAANSVALSIQRALADFGATSRTNLPVVITGHSLGGAMATLTGFNLNRLGLNVDSVYAHATPMVGDKEFGDAYSRAGILYCRTVHKDDAVPEIPQNIVETLTFLLTLKEEASKQPSHIRNFFNAMDVVFPLSPRLRRAYSHVPGTLAYINHNNRIVLNPAQETVNSNHRPGLNVKHHKTVYYLTQLHRAMTAAEKRRVSGLKVIVN